MCGQRQEYSKKCLIYFRTLQQSEVEDRFSLLSSYLAAEWLLLGQIIFNTVCTRLSVPLSTIILEGCLSNLLEVLPVIKEFLMS